MKSNRSLLAVYRSSGRLALSMMLLCGIAGAAPQGKTQAQAKARKYPKPPEDVERRSVTIWSDGTRMAGDIYQPKNIKDGEKRGGLTTYVAAHDSRVKASAAQAPGMGGGRGGQYEIHAHTQQTQRARADIEPVPFKTGAPGGKMSSYAHMRYNLAKGIGYDVFEAAERIKTPMLIIDAGKEELMDITKNGGKVAGILKANGVPVKYHVYDDINHYGIYGKRLDDAAKMEIEFFDQHLKLKEKRRA